MLREVSLWCGSCYGINKNYLGFFQKEILGMHWLNRLLGDMLNGVGLDVRE